MDQDVTWSGASHRPIDVVLNGDPAPPPQKGAQPPNFRPMFIAAKRLDGRSWYLACRQASPRRHCNRWGPRPLSKRGAEPTTKFSVHVYCGQTAGWMKVVLGMEVGLSPGDLVLDGHPVPFPQKGAEPPSPIFGPLLLWPNGLMHQNASWYGCWPQPRELCVRWRPSPPFQTKGAEPSPNLRPISIVPKQLDASRCHSVWKYASAQASLC